MITQGRGRIREEVQGCGIKVRVVGRWRMIVSVFRWDLRDRRTNLLFRWVHLRDRRTNLLFRWDLRHEDHPRTNGGKSSKAPWEQEHEQHPPSSSRSRCKTEKQSGPACWPGPPPRTPGTPIPVRVTGKSGILLLDKRAVFLNERCSSNGPRRSSSPSR